MLIAENREVAGVRPPRFGLDKAKTAVDAHAKSFDLARRAGVRIAAGTDYLHGSLHLELALMVRYGMPPANALRSATFEAA